MAWLPLTSFSKELSDTIIEIEDKRFLEHWGVDGLALFRALLAYSSGRSLQGASTITMQVSDLIQPEVLLQNKPIKKGKILGKFKQIWRAFFIDLSWSKNQILETYLNLIHLRGELQGVHSFTYGYFNKSPQFLSPEESIIIATLIRKPNVKTTALFKSACRNIKKINVENDCSHLEQVTNNSLKKRPVISNPHNLAPHYARKVFSKTPGSQTIQSFIDSKIQQKVYSILEKNLISLRANKVNDMAAVVVDNKSGKILAYVGTIDRFSKSSQVDGADSARQAGSTLKPFLYGKAIEKKIITPASIIPDEPTVFSWSGKIYRPVNYDQKFHGSVTVKQALGSSLNIPAVKS